MCVPITTAKIIYVSSISLSIASTCNKDVVGPSEKMEKNGKNGKTEKPPSPVSNEREAYVNAPPVATISISAQRSPTLCHTNCCTLFVACQQMAKTAKKCDYRFAKIDYTLQIPSGGIGGGADGVWTSL